MAWYRLHLEPDEDTLLVRSPDFEEVISFGEDEADAIFHGRDAIEEAIAGRIADNEEIPLPLDHRPDGPAVELSAMVYLKSALYTVLRRKNMSRADLQRALKLPHREQVDRLFRLDHNSNVETILDAFRVLGTRVEMRVPIPAAA